MMLQRTYLELLHVAHRLIASPEVEARWDQPSALQKYRMDALAGHPLDLTERCFDAPLQKYRMDALAGHLLNAAVVSVITGLETPAPTGIEPLSTTDYWVSALRNPQWDDVEWDVHVRLREKVNPALVPLAIYDGAARGYERPALPMVGFTM